MKDDDTPSDPPSSSSSSSTSPGSSSSSTSPSTPVSSSSSSPAGGSVKKSGNTFSGTGDAVIDIPSQFSSAIVVGTHSGSSNFIVNGVDDTGTITGDLVYNEIGKVTSAESIYGMKSYGDKPVKLKVQADGPWKLTLKPVASAPALKLPATGTKSKVFKYTKGGNVSFTHSGKGMFRVEGVGDPGGPIASGRGKNTARQAVPDGTKYIVISVEDGGAWRMKKS